MEDVVRVFEATGVIVLIVGTAVALVSAATQIRRDGSNVAYERARRGIGRSILLGLEILIIADIVLTITIEPTIESAVTLGIIVLVRTFLSFSLDVELDGTLPWRRRARSEQS